MSLDISSIINRSTTHVANKTKLGNYIANPFLVGIIITAIVILILYIWAVPLSFKLVFYTFLGVIITVLAHDTVLLDQYKEKYESAYSATIGEPAAMNGGSIRPRADIDEITESYNTRLPPVPDNITAGGLLAQLDNTTYRPPVTSMQPGQSPMPFLM